MHWLDTLATVISRDGKDVGTVTSATRSCQLEGCRGIRIGVRWSNGQRTFPCSKGLTSVDDTTAQIL